MSKEALSQEEEEKEEEGVLQSFNCWLLQLPLLPLLLLQPPPAPPPPSLSQLGPIQSKHHHHITGVCGHLLSRCEQLDAGVEVGNIGGPWEILL